MEGQDKIWDQSHGGELTWKDENQEVHEMTLGAAFRMRSGDTAEFLGNITMTTPFKKWENNHIIMR